MVNFPTVQWIEQSLSIDPSGSRHLLDTGFIKQLGTGAGEFLDFGQLNTTGSGAISDTHLAYARVSDLGDASGVFNMKFFLTNTSAFGLGTFRFLERKSIPFEVNLALNSSANNTPTVIPTDANFLGTATTPEFPNGKPWMSGTIDIDASQYVYIALEAGIDVPVGRPLLSFHRFPARSDKSCFPDPFLSPARPEKPRD